MPNEYSASKQKESLPLQAAQCDLSKSLYVKDALLRAYHGRYAVQITAERGAYNGLEQLSSITAIKLLDSIGTPFPMPTVVTSVADLSDFIAQQVRLEGLVYVSQATDSYGNVDFEFTLGSETVDIRWDSRTGDPVGFPLTLEAGDVIDAVVGVYWSNGARLRVDAEGDFTVPLMTISVALSEAADTIVTVRGFVTMNIDGNNFLLQDDTGAVDIYLGSGASAEKDAILAAYLGGYAIEIQAKRGAYNGLEQVSNVAFVNIISVPGFDFPTPVDVTAMDVTDLSAYTAQLVEFKELEVVSIAYDNYGNLDIEVTNGTATFFIRWDSRTGDPVGLPTELEAGDIINVVAGAYWSNSLRLRIASADAIEKVVISNSTPELFISEYVEGSSNNKAIELYNPTDAALDLTGYMVHIYSNGSPTASKSFDLTGITLGAGETFVIVTDTFEGTGTYDEVQAYADGDAVVFFNGDDALAITKNGEIIDVFGIIGEDPGSNWSVGDGFTNEYTLVRKPGVTSGSTVWDPTEWIVYPQNTFDNLGSHTV